MITNKDLIKFLSAAKDWRTNMFSEDYYLKRVRQLESEGLTTSDAQSIVDIEERNETFLEESGEFLSPEVWETRL